MKTDKIYLMFFLIFLFSKPTYAFCMENMFLESIPGIKFCSETFMKKSGLKFVENWKKYYLLRLKDLAFTSCKICSWIFASVPRLLFQNTSNGLKFKQRYRNQLIWLVTIGFNVFFYLFSKRARKISFGICFAGFNLSSKAIVKNNVNTD